MPVVENPLDKIDFTTERIKKTVVRVRDSRSLEPAWGRENVHFTWEL